ncbi:MAG: HmuY family protein [Polyangiaceae bacterium]|nr:HmuY family protein [Polyangiaceae bacterium]
MNRTFFAAALCLFVAGCSESVGNPSSTGTTPNEDPGKTLEVPVSASSRTFVSYKEPAIVTPMGDGSMDSSWDIAFEKYDIFTNSGVSGPGDGGAFGPLDAATYDEGIAPTVPFVTKDQTGGPFSDYWAYDPMMHVLWVRYHVFGVREGDKLWKVQILGYYGEMQGAPIAAIYRLRWAEVTSSGAGPTQELVDIDGTAGGSQPADDVPSECLDLGSGARVFHTPASALATKDWHLCFRRATISVNGELGGPRGVTAVDLHAGESKNETLAILRERTADTELARFDAVGHSELTAANLVWRGDRVISAFSDYWVDPATNPKAPANFSWLTMAADGVTRYLLVFDRFEGPTEESPGKVVLRIRPEGL